MITLKIAFWGGLGIWGIYVLCQIIYSTWLWIQDSEQKVLLSLPWGDDDIGLNMAFSILYAIGFFIVVLAWKIAVPIVILGICAFGMRWAIRFKKKVNKAIDKCNFKKKEGDKHIMGESW